MNGLVLERLPEQEPDTTEGEARIAASFTPRWINKTLERFVVLLNWRITSANLKLLSQEWTNFFGKWRVTDQVVDLAVEMACKQWLKMPDNTTKAFSEILCRAQDEVERLKNPQVVVERSFGALDSLIDACTAVCKKIKQKHPEMDYMNDIPIHLNSLRITAKQQNPDADDLALLRIVWGMV